MATMTKRKPILTCSLCRCRSIAVRKVDGVALCDQCQKAEQLRSRTNTKPAGSE